MEKEPVEGQLVNSPAENDFGDVLVVGGGISGIQAALDLADTGLRVYLVEKSPAIGGKMAQLDKTYPTNDCSKITVCETFHKLSFNWFFFHVLSLHQIVVLNMCLRIS